MSELNERFHASKVAWLANEKLEGRAAGGDFASKRGDYSDLVALRRFLDSGPTETDLAAELFACYRDADLTPGEFNQALFGDANAEPTDEFIEAFVEAALEVLEQAEAECTD